MSIFESWGKGGRPKSHKLILPDKDDEEEEAGYALADSH